MNDHMAFAVVATLNEEATHMVTGGKRRVRRHWAASEVLAAIVVLSRIAPRAVQHSQPWLYGAAVRQFGSWRAAVMAAGIDYDTRLGRRAPGFWDRAKVLEAIKCLEDKTSSHVRRRDRGLYSAALRLFGSWEAAVTQAGYSYREIARGWVAMDGSGLRFRKKGE